MRRTLLLWLLVLVVAGVIGTLAARDPGYVLLSYDGTTLQTGLWVFIAGLVVLGFSVVLLLRLWRSMFSTAQKFQRWQQDRALNRSIEHTSRGLVYLQEGNLERAEKFLMSGANHQPQPVINYLNLAKAANGQDKAEMREKYLRLATEADKNASNAIAILRAELALERKAYAECLSSLENIADSNKGLYLKASALDQLEDFAALEVLLPKLRKVLPSAAYSEIETRVVLAGIRSDSATEEQRLGAYRAASETVRHNPLVVAELCKFVTAEKDLEVILRKILKQSWQPDIVESYGELGDAHVQKRLKTALAWRDQHPLDPGLHYCIGRLQQLNGETDAARESFQKAVDGNGHTLASQELAALYADAGDHKKSNEILNLAYRGA